MQRRSLKVDEADTAQQSPQSDWSRTLLMLGFFDFNPKTSTLTYARIEAIFGGRQTQIPGK